MFQTIANEFAASFTIETRDSGDKFTKLVDNPADWITSDTMHDIHRALDDRFPCDWVYDTTRRIAESLTEYDCDSADSARDVIPEIAGNLTDCYTWDLLKWLADRLDNIALVDQFREEFGTSDIETEIRGAQAMAIERIGFAIVEAIETESENRESIAD